MDAYSKLMAETCLALSPSLYLQSPRSWGGRGEAPAFAQPAPEVPRRVANAEVIYLRRPG